MKGQGDKQAGSACAAGCRLPSGQLAPRRGQTPGNALTACGRDLKEEPAPGETGHTAGFPTASCRQKEEVFIMSIPGFRKIKVPGNGIDLSVHLGGSGPPLLLLHGFPQNHMCWERVAPALAQRFSCIVPDLRGYGESETPIEIPDHQRYSKRNMGCDMACLLDALDQPVTAIVGHDRGARVAYRFALDFPERISRLAVIEIVPTGDFWGSWNADLAFEAYHWTFLAQPAPLPERLILGAPHSFVDTTLERWTASKSLDAFSPDALESYRRQARSPEHVSAMCNDYRAGYHVDRILDQEDRRIGRRIGCPVHLIWSENGFPARTGDPLGLWRNWTWDLSGTEIQESGHFVMEEAPEATTAALLAFLSEKST